MMTDYELDEEEGYAEMYDSDMAYEMYRDEAPEVLEKRLVAFVDEFHKTSETWFSDRDIHHIWDAIALIVDFRKQRDSRPGLPKKDVKKEVTK